MIVKANSILARIAMRLPVWALSITSARVGYDTQTFVCIQTKAQARREHAEYCARLRGL